MPKKAKLDQEPMRQQRHAGNAERRPAYLDWKRDLQQLIDQHNVWHAQRTKHVGHGTQSQRAAGLFRWFAVLHAAGFRIAARELSGKHIEFLVRYWTADPSVPAELAARGARLAPRTRPYSAAYIQQQLSFMRGFARWIGKDGMALPAERYVTDTTLVTRSVNATHDRSWSAAQVDIDQKLAQVYECDEVVGLTLELIRAFGLRVREALMFSPHAAEVPAHALPASAQPARYLAFLRIKRGTKGGRLRYTAIRNALQEQALARANAFVCSFGPRPLPQVGRPGMSLKQAQDHFYYVLRKCGITKAQLGMTAHGLRHEFAGDLYYELANVKPPVAGGPAPSDRATMDAAYLEVARQLGHGRPQIAGAYLGSRTQARPANSDHRDEARSSGPSMTRVGKADGRERRHRSPARGPSASRPASRSGTAKADAPPRRPPRLGKNNKKLVR
jgi:hypothetical protein